MNNSLQQRASIERLIARVLRDQPLQRAPATLEARVLAAITARSAVPWWRHSFVNWPRTAQAMFLVASAGFIRLGLAVGDRALSLFGSLESGSAALTLAPGIAWTQAALDVATVVNETLRAASAGIPPLWLYGGSLCVVALYGLFFGLTAAGYRALHASR